MLYFTAQKYKKFSNSKSFSRKSIEKTQEGRQPALLSLFVVTRYDKE